MRRCQMEATINGGRFVAIGVAWLVTVIALALTVWVARLGGHAVVIGAASSTGLTPYGGLPWG